MKSKIGSVNKEQLLVLILICLFLGAYLDIPLTIGNAAPIPSITNVLLIIAITPYLIRKFTASDIYFLGGIVFIVLISVIGADNFRALPSIIVKIFQFLFSIYVFIVTIFIVRSISLKQLHKFFFILIVILLIGIVLEYLNVIRGVSDKFREIVYTADGYILYDAEDRDIVMTGFVRPSLFTSEPSLVSCAFFIVSMCYLLLSTKLKQFLFVIVSSIVFLIVSGSPIPLINLICGIVLLLFFLKLKWYQLLLGILIFIILFFTLFTSQVSEKIVDRLQSRLIEEVTEEGNSSYSRIYVAYVDALPTALTYNPFFGVGYGGKQKMVVITGNEGADIKDRGQMEGIEGANAFTRFFVYFGAIGGIMVLYAIFKYFKSQSIRYFGLFIFIWILFSQTLGTFETPRYWVYLALVAGTLAVRTKFDRLTEKNKSERI